MDIRKHKKIILFFVVLFLVFNFYPDIQTIEENDLTTKIPECPKFPDTLGYLNLH